MDNQQSEKGWLDKIKSGLFARKATDTDIKIPSNGTTNPDSRREGETYQQWGIRMCGIVQGTLTALPACLQKVYLEIYRHQVENKHLQEQARANTQSEIDQKNLDKQGIEAQKSTHNNIIDSFNRKIDELKEEKRQIQGGNEKVNKQERLKLIIGILIILPLTFYLFLFYSSTFYSSFFRNPENLDSLANAMFDGSALSHALTDGATEFAMCLTAPIIFMALGFALHFFTTQNDKLKYFKICAILLVTFMFDCILAYKIGEQLHTFGVVIGQYPIGEEYTISMAVHDVNSWAVIFCGFIVYILWGIVFSLCMNAYNKMDFNKTRLEEIKGEIDNYEHKIRNEQDQINALNIEIANLNNIINELMRRLGNEAYIDYASVKQEMNNFFVGWASQMQMLSIPLTTQNEAKEIFDREMSTLIPQNNK